jgi:hypothetical protein
MKLRALALSTASILLCAGLPALATDASMFKQLAGGPDEFESMRAPNPAAGAIHSKSALLAVELTPDKSGRLSWQGSLPLDRSDPQVLLLADSGHGWQLGLRSPSGSLQKAGLLAASVKRGEFGMESTRFPSELYQFQGLHQGTWKLEVQAAGTAPRQGFLLVEGNPAVELSSHPSHLRFHAGGELGLTARLSAEIEGEIALGAAAGRIEEAYIRVTRADGSVEKVAMFDDGLHADGAAGDGVFGGLFAAGAAGPLQAQVVVKGVGPNGAPLLRSAEHLIPVVEAGLALGSSARASLEKSGSGDRLRLSVPLTVAKAQAAGHLRAYAEVWGRDSRGRPRAVAWVGGMVELRGGEIGLGFDPRWVAKSGAVGPFELRNLRLEDPNHFVALAEAETLPLAMSVPMRKYAAAELAVDEAMQMGPRPATLRAKGSGSRLILVHGYCSGGVWPSSHFSNASTFLDANKNRSHDQFARLIRDFGATWHSFGTVAHSQGGAASLHLYTYYWSGLDNAGAGRLMQSVGTPYQGTNLAGVLAALGGIFGVGCGSNDNLTYSGAASWLSGIPSWARSKVNYYTTSFANTGWWTNDYCNFASDLVLSDPEDGTIERAYGQLSGATNRGHTSGQCHTQGMRDPAQYLDSGRNAVMNSNAAR